MYLSIWYAADLLFKDIMELLGEQIFWWKYITGVGVWGFFDFPYF